VSCDRYPKDVYDRSWVPYIQPEWTQISTTSNVSNKNHYDPPQVALKMAATPTSLDVPLTMVWRLENPDDQIYLYMHFSEIQVLKANDTREFDIILNGETINTRGVTPKYLEIMTWLTTNPRQCNGGICRMQLTKTQKSTLPPLLNAFEVYSVLQLPQSQTNEIEGIKLKEIVILSFCFVISSSISMKTNSLNIFFTSIKFYASGCYQKH